MAAHRGTDTRHIVGRWAVSPMTGGQSRATSPRTDNGRDLETPSVSFASERRTCRSTRYPPPDGGAGGNEAASLKRETRFAAGFPMPFTVRSGDGRRHGWGRIHAISAYQHKPPSNKPQPELRVQQCRGDRRGHGPSVATTTTASLGLRACSGPIARPTGRAHLSAGCAAPGRILPCPCFSGVGLPILGASSGEQLAFDGLRLRRARKGARCAG